MHKQRLQPFCFASTTAIQGPTYRQPACPCPLLLLQSKRESWSHDSHVTLKEQASSTAAPHRTPIRLPSSTPLYRRLCGLANATSPPPRPWSRSTLTVPRENTLESPQISSPPPLIVQLRKWTYLQTFIAIKHREIKKTDFSCDQDSVSTVNGKASEKKWKYCLQYGRIAYIFDIICMAKAQENLYKSATLF